MAGSSVVHSGVQSVALTVDSAEMSAGHSAVLMADPMADSAAKWAVQMVAHWVDQKADLAATMAAHSAVLMVGPKVDHVAAQTVDYLAAHSAAR